MLKKLFGQDKDESKQDQDQVQREDKRGTGDEAPEHPPAVVAEAADAGHTPDPGARAVRRDATPTTEMQGQRDESYHPDPPNRNPGRDEGRSLSEEAQILADDMIGQKATTEGTAGRDGSEPPERRAE